MQTEINQGRVNNAVRALGAWYRAVAGREPGYNDGLVFHSHAVAVLEADDKYLIGQSRIAADVTKLQVHLAKAREEIDRLKRKGKAQRTAIQQRAEDLNIRERKATEAMAEFAELKRQAWAWQRADEEHVRQLNIARDQLVANGIEPDRRIM